MLKVEPSKKQGVQVSLRQAPSIWNHLFLKALFLALSIHALAFLLFAIAPFKILKSIPNMEPVFVQSDFMDSELQALAAAEEREALPYHYPKEPEKSSPDISKSFFLKSEKIGFLQTTDITYPALFSGLERVKIKNFKSKTKEQNKPLRFQAIGSLVERRLIQIPLNYMADPAKITGLYRILVDNKKGDVFYFEPIENQTLNDADLQLLSAFFNEMKFAPLEKGFAESYEIFLKSGDPA